MHSQKSITSKYMTYSFEMQTQSAKMILQNLIPGSYISEFFKKNNIVNGMVISLLSALLLPRAGYRKAKKAYMHTKRAFDRSWQKTQRKTEFTSTASIPLR